MCCGFVWLSRYKTSKDQHSVFTLESPSVSLYRGETLATRFLECQMSWIPTWLDCVSPQKALMEHYYWKQWGALTVLVCSSHSFAVFTAWFYWLDVFAGTFLACRWWDEVESKDCWLSDAQPIVSGTCQSARLPCGRGSVSATVTGSRWSCHCDTHLCCVPSLRSVCDGVGALAGRPHSWLCQMPPSGVSGPLFDTRSTGSSLSPGPKLFSCFLRAMASQQERTFIAIKPDGVQRGIIGEIIKRFEAKGFKLVGMKLMSVSAGRLLPEHRGGDCNFHNGGDQFRLDH